MTSINSFKVGDFIRSGYRARYKGMILKVEDRSHIKKCGSLLTILILEYSNGTLPRKRQLQVLDEYWVNKIDPFDISYINKDWYDIH